MYTPGIRKLSRHTLENRKKYFLDANVWLYFLNLPYELEPEEEVYVRVFDEFLEGELAIYTHSLVISEVFNAYMRTYYRMYLKEENLKPKQYKFKEDYRGSKDYKEKEDIFREDFEAIEPQLRYLDKNTSFTASDVVASLQGNEDFNDLFYIHLARQHQLSVITHDGDFHAPGLEILTENRHLLRRR